TTLHDAYCDTRSYDNWSMAYRSLNAPDGPEATFREVKDFIDEAHDEGAPVNVGPLLRSYYDESLTHPGCADRLH
ncbi:MAG: hypothetical protein AAGJ87_13620, partial [Pseudomonadota bacterium]